MSRVLRNPIALAFAAIVALILIGSTFAIIPETEQAVIVRFGKVDRTANRYRPGETFGATRAGLIVRIPFVEDIVRVDKRIQSVGMENQQVLSTDQLRLQVDAFARYRIVDPLRMYITAKRAENVSDQLKPILGSALRNELGKRPSAALLSPERAQLMQNIRTALNRVAAQYGAQVIDVRIKRTDLPEGAPLDAAFDRMRTARQQEARSIQAQGLRDAQLVRADADAEAASIYAEAFGKDPDFYDFYRAMQSYETTFVNNAQNPDAGRSSVILSPENQYLREFTGRR
ncbi:protease modulator HflC [Sphingosinicella sp. BN140058]|uniref:protease modulator HflC n=1 Tax=Sphingosinicella sp. BN140058 TaxID=1892855 RepID=UPI001012B7A7|nr:protease modulator HflC [Sphingosinicella sp. BN140058]QAY75805.1 protease modulator HflC [Sphingosinicella sp. BN140058]